MTEMKLFLRFIHKSFLLILVVLVGCPTTPDTLLNQGIKHLNKGQYDKAILDFTKAIGINPSAEAYYRRGTAYTDKAFFLFSKAIEIEIKDQMLAAGYYRSKDDYADKAFSDLNKAIELNPKYAAAYESRGRAYYNKEQYDKAIADLNEAIELNPMCGEAYFFRGIAYFSRAVPFDRSNAEVWKAIYDKSMADFNKAIEVNPEYPKTYEFRGLFYIFMGQSDKAKADWNKAMEKYYLRASSYKAKGQDMKACLDYGIACGLGSDAACDEYDMLKEKVPCTRRIIINKMRSNRFIQ